MNAANRGSPRGGRPVASHCPWPNPTDQARDLVETSRRLAGRVARVAGQIADTAAAVARVSAQIAQTTPRRATELRDAARRAGELAERERAEQNRWQEVAIGRGPQSLST